MCRRLESIGQVRIKKNEHEKMCIQLKCIFRINCCWFDSCRRYKTFICAIVFLNWALVLIFLPSFYWQMPDIYQFATSTFITHSSVPILNSRASTSNSMPIVRKVKTMSITKIDRRFYWKVRFIRSFCQQQRRRKKHEKIPWKHTSRVVENMCDCKKMTFIAFIKYG